MSISAYQQQPTDVQLKVVTVNPVPNATANPGVASSKIFTISFSYQQKAYRTKVMKVLYAGKDAMYKVVMPASFKSDNSVYWLQRQEQGWEIIIGEPMEAKLLKAITTAIGALE